MTMTRSPFSAPYSTQSSRPLVSTASICSERSLVDPRGQAFRTCGIYESDVRIAASTPIHGIVLPLIRARIVKATAPSFMRLAEAKLLAHGGGGCPDLFDGALELVLADTEMPGPVMD